LEQRGLEIDDRAIMHVVTTGPTSFLLVGLSAWDPSEGGPKGKHEALWMDTAQELDEAGLTLPGRFLCDQFGPKRLKAVLVN